MSRVLRMKLNWYNRNCVIFDIICITESCLDGKTSDYDIKIENFKLFRRDRPGDHHGVISFYVRNNVFLQKEDTILSYQTLYASG